MHAFYRIGPLGVYVPAWSAISVRKSRHRSSHERENLCYYGFCMQRKAREGAGAVFRRREHYLIKSISSLTKV